MKRHQTKKYFGFTLVELIIVITILAILATVAFVSFQNYTSQTRDTKRLSDLSQISKGVEVFQVGAGTVPTPDNPKTLTGGNSTLLVGKINSKVLKSLSNNILDPVSGIEYTYATIGNGKYYQIGADSENLVSSVFNSAFADAKASIVKGNYLFDPSLPSLIISSGSSLFDPNNCFVINGGTNLVSNNTNCTPKSSTSLKNFDSSLVGYWDMETTNGTNILKDLSGNGNDETLSGITYSGNSTGGILGKSINFNGLGIAESSKVLEYNNSLNITISTLVKSVASDNLNGYTGSAQLIIESSDNFNINTGSYIIGDFDYSNEDFNNYRTNGGVKYKLSPTHQYYLTRSTNKSTSGYKLVTMVLSYGKKGKEVFLYINGIKQNNDSEDPNGNYKVISPFQEDKFLNYKFYMGDRKNYNGYTKKLGFLGDIDEVKIYNRALSYGEILGQAESAGF